MTWPPADKVCWSVRVAICIHFNAGVNVLSFISKFATVIRLRIISDMLFLYRLSTMVVELTVGT